MATPSIFISYRRDDSAGHAGRLCDRLEAAFGTDRVFRDIEDIGAGDDFVETLHGQVDRCDVLLALIGPRWLDVKDAEGRPRLQHENDWVRREISRALLRGIRVIPVLFEDATMPLPEALPADLADLSRRQAAEIRDAHFAHDVDHLVALLSPTQASRRRYRIAIALLLVALLGVGGYAGSLYLENSPDRALARLKDASRPYNVESFLDAAHEGNDQVVTWFLQAGMDPNSGLMDRLPAMVYAISAGRPEMVRSLLEHGADTTEALGIAVGREQDAIVEMLFAQPIAAADAQYALGNAAAKGRIDYLQRLVDLGAELDASNGAAMRDAAANVQVATLRWLIARGAKPAAARDETGWTALHVAATRRANRERDPKAVTEMIGLLLAAGADANASAAPKGRPGGSALLAAADVGNTDAARALIEGGAEINARTTDGTERTALMLAAEQNQPEMIKALITLGADIDARNASGMTALALAVQALSPAAVGQLLQANASVDTRSNSGLTPLLQVSGTRLPANSRQAANAAVIVKLLLGAGASRDAADHEGRFPLGVAIAAGTPEILTALRQP